MSEEIFRNETKNHNPAPFKLNGRSLIVLVPEDDVVKY